MPFFSMSNERSCPFNSYKTFLFQQVFRDCLSFQKHLETNVLGADPRTPFSDRVTKTTMAAYCFQHAFFSIVL